MKEKTRKIIQWTALVVAIIGAICAILFAIDQTKFSGMFNVAYVICLCLAIVSLLAMVVSLIIRIVKGEGKGFLIGLCLLAVVIGVSFLLSSGTDLSDAFLVKNGATQATSKWVGASCYAVYILAGACVLAVIYVEVSQLFKKK